MSQEHATDCNTPSQSACGTAAGFARLKSRPQFQAVLSGTALARTAHFVLHSTTLSPAAAVGKQGARPGPPLFAANTKCLGAMIPKRWAKRAVTRNAIRRQIYSVSQLYSNRLNTAAHVVRLRSSFDTTQFVSASSAVLKHAVRAELESLFERACAACAPSPSRQG